MDKTGDRQAVFQFFTLHAVPPDQHDIGLFQLIQTALNDLSQYGNIHLLKGKANQIHGRFRNSAHGIDIAQGIGSRNLAECIRVIDYRCKKIYRLDDGLIVGNLINAGIVRTVHTHNHMVIGWNFQAAQGALQVPRRQF